MKKFILGCFIASYSIVNATDSNNIGIYGGFGLSATFTTSEYNMNFSTNINNAGSDTGGPVNQKFSGRKKLGYNIFLGMSGGENYYYAFELGANLHRLKLNKDLSDYEAKEMGVGVLDPYGALHTKLRCDYGNEFNLALKFGKRLSTKSFGQMIVYGILGLSTRDLKVQYDYYVNNFPLWEEIFSQYSHHFSKRLWAFTPGIGAEFKIYKNCSLGIEYKYKFYPNSSSSKDLQDAPIATGMLRGDMDIGARSYKVKSSQNVLSLRLVFNI